MRNRILAFLLFFLVAAGAHAQCTGGLISNCPAAVNPATTDLLLSWQNNQTPHTRAMTTAQALTAALGAQLTKEIVAMPATTANAGLNLGVGSNPTNCVNGDVWTTGAGLFSCVNGAPTGPYGTGANTLPVYASVGNLPTVTSANQGQLAFVSNCLNGNQLIGSGTGCLYVVNTLGTWTAQPDPFSSAIIVGGQNLYPGGSTTNQGNGAKLQLATGSFVVGHALAYDNNGNAVDSGVPPSGGTGGAGTITGGPQNAIPFYSTAGTSNVLSALTVANNAVLATNGSGIPSEVTTLPSGLSFPSGTISNATMTGTITYNAATNFTGKQSFAASSAGGALLNLAPGTAPSSPVNGDMWTTTAGLFTQANGVTQGPHIYNVTTTSPLSGGGVGPSLTITCPTCALTTNGGTLTATAPMTISASGLIALGLQPQPIVWIADSTTTVHNDTYNIVEKWPYTNTGTITSVTYHTGGTSNPSFQISLQINGVNVTSCNGLSVSSATDTTTTCTAANNITNGQTLALVISAAAGVPTSAVVQVNMSKPAS